MQSYSKLSSNGGYYFVTFIIWPFMSFILALLNYRQKEARTVIYFFLIYYGLSFVVNTRFYVDTAGYAEHLRAHAALPFSDFFKIVGGLYSGTSVDVVEPFISFIVSRFTAQYEVYMGVWAAIFGYFYLKSINEIYNIYSENPGWNGRILMTFFIVIMPITFINGVRMWTAGWIFFYAAYQLIVNNDKRYFLLALFASLVHWSFFSAFVILVIYYIIGNRNYIYFPLAILSFIIPNAILPLFQTISSSLGAAFQSRYSMYTDEQNLLARASIVEDADLIFKITHKFVLYYLLAVILIMQVNKKIRNDQTRGEKNLYSFVLLFLTFINFGMVIPSLGQRFQIIFFLFATTYVFLLIQKLPVKRINILSIIAIIPILLYSTIIIRQGTESISAWIFTPIFGVPWIAPSLSLADLLFY